LGLLTVIALQRLGFNPDLLVVAEHSYEADLVRSMSDADVVLAHSPGSCYEEVAAFVKGVVRFPEAGRLTLEGGAHLVYETAGTPERMEDALRFTGEGMQLVLMNPGRTSGCDMAPLWLKGIKIHGTAFSGTESYEGKERVAFDIAMELATEQGLPVDRLISHRFKLDEYRQALTVLADRVANRAVKVLLTHVV
jgi:threonine dehydrogenase-like Zn-dependent dehydrogenase